jgi:hypothetical protein
MISINDWICMAYSEGCWHTCQSDDAPRPRPTSNCMIFWSPHQATRCLSSACCSRPRTHYLHEFELFSKG